MNDPHDELDDLLAPPPAPAVRPEVQAAVFRQTERVLGRVRLSRRVTRIGLAAAVFLAGGMTGWLAKSKQTQIERIPSPAEVVIVPVVVPVAEPESVSKPPAPVSASGAEQLAEQADDPAEAARLYRVAGDKYLNDLQDYGNATRCYRLFLLGAGAPGLSPEPGDTWLLTSLKNAAFKEKSHVAKTDG